MSTRVVLLAVTLHFRVSAETDKRLIDLARTTGRSPSDIARDALTRGLHDLEVGGAPMLG